MGTLNRVIAFTLVLDLHLKVFSGTKKVTYLGSHMLDISLLSLRVLLRIPPCFTVPNISDVIHTIT